MNMSAAVSSSFFCDFYLDPPSIPSVEVMGDGEFGVHLNFMGKVQQRLCTNGAVGRSGWYLW